MKKRILIFHQCAAIGGASTSLLHIIESIDRDKFDIQVVCPQKPDGIINDLLERNVQVIETKKTPILFPHYNGGIKYALSVRTFLNLYQIWKDKPIVKKIIKDNDPDIVMVNSMTMYMIGAYAKAYGKRTICFHRETYQKGVFGLRTNIIKRGLSKNFDKVVFISEYDCRMTQPCKAEKFVIYDKVDLSLYQNYDNEQIRRQMNIKPEDKVVLYLGGISKLKGGHIILNAMNYIQDKDVKLVFVSNIGKEIMDDSIRLSEKILAKLKVSSLALIKKAYQNVANRQRIMFLKTSNQPEKYYSLADLIVFPSTIAHQARPIYEAGAARVPIVISDFKETREFAQDGINAVTFIPGSAEDLAKRIDMLFANPKKYEQVVNKNYEMTWKNHNLKDLKQEMVALLEDLQ